MPEMTMLSDEVSERYIKVEGFVIPKNQYIPENFD